MCKLRSVMLTGFLVLILLGCSRDKQKSIVVKTEVDRVSYSLGMNIAKGLKRQGVEINSDIFAKAVNDVIIGNKTMLTEEEMRETLRNYQKELREKMKKEREIIGEKNQKESTIFLEANKKKEGVITLPSGLQYKILKEGTGKFPKPTDTVICNYKGTLIDGTVFDSSYERGNPATFTLNRVIKGWQEALPLMKVGSKWELYVPGELGYGKRGSGQKIGPDAALIFEIELLSIKEILKK